MFAEGGEAHAKGGVKKRDGSRYVPTQWGLKFLNEDVNAWDYALAAWQEPNEIDPIDPATGELRGYDQLIAEAGPEFTWEGILIGLYDPNQPWVDVLKREVPQVFENIRSDLERRTRGTLVTKAARREQEKQEWIARIIGVLDNPTPEQQAAIRASLEERWEREHP